MDRVTSRYLLVLFALFMWALSFPAIKFALEEVEPLTLAAVRFIIPLPIIYVYYRLETKNAEKYQNSKIRSLGTWDLLINGDLNRIWKGPGMIWAFALFNVVLPNVFQNYGMQSTPSGISSIIQGSGPIFTIVLASAFLHERLTPLQIFGIMLALLGSLLLVSGGELSNDGSIIGKTFILTSAISYSISGLIGKIALKNIDAGELTFRSFTIGGAMLAICAIAIEQPLNLADLDPIYWTTIGYIALFPTCFAFLFWFRALKYVSLSRLVTSIFLIPVLAVIFSWAILGEGITSFTIGTGIMVIGGVLIAQIAGDDGEKGISTNDDN